MFCPGCGLNEERAVQFCRACGTDLRAVRASLAEPDAVTASAVVAREEIGRAIAARIREMDRVKDLEDVLPEIEKFLESPQERRLRRVREGVITSAVGVGATIFFHLLSLRDSHASFLPALGVITFLIGLGLVLNGLFLTAPKQQAPENLSGGKTSELLEGSAIGVQTALPPAQSTLAPPSVTERTTHHLSSKPLKAERRK
ncbi:MAG: zinc ribbon domain-containing protein [Acidobacteria bacterium]|nr:zinc ribbon domain-containing protein [Acidobacteriota bacterium]